MMRVNDGDMDPTFLIGDIVERDPGADKPVEFTAPPTSSTGFPQHRRRWKASAFKQRRAANLSSNGPMSQSGDNAEAPEPSGQGLTRQHAFEAAERRRIDEENRQTIASMSPREIAQAQDDIMNGVDAHLIQRLLQRANIDEPKAPSPFDPQASEQQETPPRPLEINGMDAASPGALDHVPRRKTTNAAPASTKNIAEKFDEDREPTQMPPDLFPIADPPKPIHFPPPPRLPDLDPSDPDFPATLHERYFPNLPADPSKLAWMAPVPSKDSPADKESPYYPHPEIAVSALRFDFRGRFLSPRVSRSIPSTKGLHHHGQAPEAAGYTIAELAHLARSAVPAQRCIAYQTLGRILYRLGQGEWGTTDSHPIAMGIWSSVKKGRVLESLLEAASGDGGHLGSRSYATEALWLFEKGGWKERFKGR